MLAFGRECAATRRHDTLVASRLVNVAEKINDEQERSFAAFEPADVFDAVRDVLLAEAAAARQAKSGKDAFGRPVAGQVDPAALSSYAVGLAWRTQRFADAARILDKHPEVSQAGFDRVGLHWAAEAVSEIRARTSAFATALAAADEHLTPAAADRPVAIDAYAALLARMGDDHPGALFVRYRLRQLELSVALDAGGWVPLKADARLAPFYVFAGDWVREPDGALRGTTDAAGMAVLLARLDPGPDFEIEAAFEAPDLAPRAALYNVRLLARFANGNRYLGPSIQPGVRTQGSLYGAGLTGDNIGLGEIPALVGKDRLRLRVLGDDMSVFLNDKPIGSLPRYPIRSETDPRDPPGIGIQSHRPNHTIRFRDVRIRKVTDQTP
jgi:hypothetical protein